VPEPAPGWTREEEPIARHLPLRACAGAFEAWAEAPDEASFVALVKAARAEKRQVRMLGPLADALPPEGGIVGLTIRLGAGFEDVREVPDGLYVGAAALLAPIGLRRGYEALARAPGALGEAIEDGWLAPMVARIRRFRGRGIEEVDPGEAEAKAEGRAFVLGAVLKPARLPWVPRAGEAFRPIKRRDLRELLRKHGLAGLRLGGAALAADDPAVLYNRGEATARQVRLLLQAVRERVHSATGIELEERLLPPGKGAR
jgi:UDP-N-acetylenolpyruvoylglucosamine reductase